MKPRMILDADKDLDGYSMIRRAGSILSAHGFKKESREIHKKAKMEDYDIYVAYILLKEYMDI